MTPQKSGLKTAFLNRWKVLNARTKARVVKYGLIGLVLVLAMVGYHIRQANMQKALIVRPPTEKPRELKDDLKALEKGKDSENQAQLSGVETQVKELKKQLEDLKKQPPVEAKPEVNGVKGVLANLPAQRNVKMPNAPLPPPLPVQGQDLMGQLSPIPNHPVFPPPPGGGALKPPPPPTETFAGDIEVVSAKREFKKEIEADKKKRAGQFISPFHLWRRLCFPV